MNRFKQFVCSAIVFFVSMTPAYADLIQVVFSGNIDSVTDHSTKISDVISTASTFSGSAMYDTAATPTDSIPPNWARYDILNFNISIDGTYDFNDIVSAGARVWNDFPLAVFDLIIIESANASDPNIPDIIMDTPLHTSLDLLDNSATAWDSTALPTAFDQDDFLDRRRIYIQGSYYLAADDPPVTHYNFDIRGDISTVSTVSIPDPSAVFLIGSACLIGFTGLRRKYFK